MTRAEIEEIVGQYDELARFIDEIGRETVAIEYSDARRGYVRAGLDGEISGPASELYMLDDAPFVR